MRLIDSAAMAEPCPQCGTPTTPGARFCGSCGYDLVGRPTVPTPEAAAPAPADPKRTMLGMPVAQIGMPAPAAPIAPVAPAAPIAATAPIAPEPVAPNRTMLGMPAVAMPPSPAAAPSAPGLGGFAPVPSVPASSPPPAYAAPPASAPHAAPPHAAPPPAAPPATTAAPPSPMVRTMLGMAAVDPAALTPVAPVAPPAAPAAPAPNRTMLGMPVTALPSSPMATAPAPAPSGFAPTMESPAFPAPAPSPAGPMPAAPVAPSPAAPHAGPKPAPTTNRTMLGVAVQAPAQATSPPVQKPAPTTNRTMLGVAVQAPAGSSESATPSHPQSGPSGHASAWDATDDEPVPAVVAPRSNRALLIVGALLVVLALVGGGVAFFLLRGGPTIAASVSTADGAEVLVVDVPEAPAGAKARFLGQEVALEAGRASFPLSADDLRIGDNELRVDVVGPDGAVQSASVVLSVRYRVRADLTALDRDPPALRIVADAVPGASITLDEQPVPLDATGHGNVDFPLQADAPNESPVYERNVHYRVVLPGEPSPAEGDVRVRIPFATLQLDRPGRSAITERDRIEVAGAADPEASVTLDGRPLELREGRFVTELPLPSLGESPHVVVARRPGRAPRTLRFTVRRVADLEAEARAYPVEELTYARLAASPTTYRGRRVAFEGWIYNLDVHDGRSVLQVSVRDCARGQRCPLWITYDGASEAGLNAWVRAVGELAGEQQFRSPSGEVLSVPRLDAVFLLPLEGAR